MPDRDREKSQERLSFKLATIIGDPEIPKSAKDPLGSLISRYVRDEIITAEQASKLLELTPKEDQSNRETNPRIRIDVKPSPNHPPNGKTVEKENVKD